MGAKRIWMGLMMSGWCALIVSGCARATPSPTAPPCGEDRMVVGTLALALRPWPAASTALNDLPDSAGVAYALDPPNGEGGGVIVLPPRAENRAALAAILPGQTLSLVRADCSLMAFTVTDSQPTAADPGAELATPRGLTLWVGQSRLGEGGWVVRAAPLPPTAPPALPAALPTLGADETLVVIPTAAPPTVQAEISLLDVTFSAVDVATTVEIRNYGPEAAHLDAAAVTLRDATGQVLALQTSQPPLPVALPVGEAVSVRLVFARPAALPAVLEVLGVVFDVEE